MVQIHFYYFTFIETNTYDLLFIHAIKNLFNMFPSFYTTGIMKYILQFTESLTQQNIYV